MGKKDVLKAMMKMMKKDKKKSLDVFDDKPGTSTATLKNELAQEKSGLAKLKKTEAEIKEYGGTETTSRHIREKIADAMPRSSDKAIKDSIEYDKKFEADFDKKLPQMKDKSFQEKLKIHSDLEPSSATAPKYGKDWQKAERGEKLKKGSKLMKKLLKKKTK